MVKRYKITKKGLDKFKSDTVKDSHTNLLLATIYNFDKTEYHSIIEISALFAEATLQLIQFLKKHDRINNENDQVCKNVITYTELYKYTSNYIDSMIRTGLIEEIQSD